jgi:hypothetical protein
MGDQARRRDRGAVATEYGLVLTLVSVLIGGIVAAFGAHLFPDPCSLFPTICADEQQQGGESSNGQNGQTDPGPIASPTGEAAASGPASPTASASDSASSSESESSSACPSPSTDGSTSDTCPSTDASGTATTSQ